MNDLSSEIVPQKIASTDRRDVIVIGGGPVGVKVAKEAIKRGFSVTLFNAERWAPYNRIKLTPFLSGDVQIGQVYLPFDFDETQDIETINGQHVTAIDPLNHTVTAESGLVRSYSNLVICTGSTAFVPQIPVVNTPGVFTFRDFNDVEKMIAKSVRARHVVIVGGGLLGLEAGKAMADRKIKTTVLEHEHHVMMRQLDSEAGRLLKNALENMDISVCTSVGVKAIYGEHSAEGVILSDGTDLKCDMVILCTGVRANIHLARQAGLTVGRGIRVNENMQTSNPSIYAAGECVQFEDNVYGLVGPGLEQAQVAISTIVGEENKYFKHSFPVTRLKVVGVDVFSMGDIEQSEQRPDLYNWIYTSKDKKTYRKLVFHHGELVGAMAIGEWNELNALQQAILNKTRIWPSQYFRFILQGNLWSENDAQQSVTYWPSAATVCNCTGVTRGMIGDSISQGAGSIEQVMQETGASTVCGSCRPLINELIVGPEHVTHEPVGYSKPLAFGSAFAAFVAVLTVTFPGMSMSQSVVSAWSLESFWLDSYQKQVTGFTLLGLTVLALVISLRKRVRLFNLFNFYGWRLVHSLIGLLIVGVLFFHTGFHMGSNLNFWLMASFILTLAIGGLSGLIVAFEHKMLNEGWSSGNASPRKLPVWLHILAFWPVPLLLALHILTVYFY